MHNYSPLTTAIMANDEKEVKKLIENKVSVNNYEEEGTTPLMFAAYYQNLNVIRMLLEYKADINQICNKNEMTPLRAAIQGGDDVNVIKLLLEHKATDINGAYTPILNRAAIEDRNKIVKMLINEYKMDINSKDISGNTPLMNASAMGSLATVKTLLKLKGVNIHQKNSYDNTARDRALRAGNHDILEVLDKAIAFRKTQNIILCGLFGSGENSLKKLSCHHLFDRNTIKLVFDFIRPK